MVSTKSVEDQLKKIGFSTNIWNRAETVELSAILLPDETIFECVNGWYEGGFALLCATDIRILLVDKKPFKFLTVEDLRFDTINQIDYGHRLMDAHITVAAGMKNLKFRSYNQQRLRKLIGHVQHRMAEIKTEQASHTQNQHEHLKQIDQQLQTYLLAQYQQHESMRRQIYDAGSQLTVSPFVPNIADRPITTTIAASANSDPSQSWAGSWAKDSASGVAPNQDLSYQPVNGVTTNDLYQEGIKEIYGRHLAPVSNQTYAKSTVPVSYNSIEINPLKIAYSKLPMLLRNRRYARASMQGSVSGPVALSS